MKLLKDIIKPRDVFWVSAEDTVRQAVRYMCERKTGAVVVKEKDEVVGVFSERDVLHRVINEERDPDAVTVREVMTTEIIFIHLDDETEVAKAKMFKNRVRHLVVVGNGNQLRGLISMRDLIEADMASSTELIQKLNDAYYEKAYKAKWRISSNRVIIEEYTPQQ